MANGLAFLHEDVGPNRWLLLMTFFSVIDLFLLEKVIKSLIFFTMLKIF